MASKQLERSFIDRMLANLGWTADDVLDGDEPPDFYVLMSGGRIAVEVTRIYQREHPKKGSPDAAQEQEFEQFVRSLADEYFASEAPQAIQVSVALPSIIRGAAVRQFSRKERQADATAVVQKALGRLRHLAKLMPWERHKFQVRQRDGRPVTFHVLGLPAGTGLDRRWDVMNNTVGWVGNVVGQRLQQKVNAKAQDLPKYRHMITSACLLIVADGSRASGFLDLAPGVAVDCLGLDAVYFQNNEGTRKVPVVNVIGGVGQSRSAVRFGGRVPGVARPVPGTSSWRAGSSREPSAVGPRDGASRASSQRRNWDDASFFLAAAPLPKRE